MTSVDPPRQRRDLLIQAQRLTLATDQIEDELEVFRARDVPAFQAWFKDRFLTERDQIKDLEAQLNQLTERHNAIVALAKMHDLSMERAYRLIEQEDHTFATANPATRDRIATERERRRGFIGEDLEAEFRARTRADVAAPTEETPVINLDELKTVYRKLARRLHPDLEVDPNDAGETRWRRRFWGLLQTARDRGDAFGLTDLYLVTRVRQLEFRDFTLDEARRARAWLEREHEELSTEHQRARETVAWNFTLTSTADLERRVTEELRRDAGALTADIRELTEEHEYLRLLGAEPRPTGTSARRARATRRPVTTVQQLSFFD